MTAILNAVRRFNRWVDQLPTWQWALVTAASCVVGMAIAEVGILLTGHHQDAGDFIFGGVMVVAGTSMGVLGRAARREANGADHQCSRGNVT